MSPLRIYIPLIFVILFVAWILYRLLIKKDLSKNKPGLYTGIVFIAVWACIYYFFLK